MIVERAVASGEKHPVCLDEVWGSLGYTSKMNAVRMFTILIKPIKGLPKMQTFHGRYCSQEYLPWKVLLPGIPSMEGDQN